MTAINEKRTTPNENCCILSVRVLNLPSCDNINQFTTLLTMKSLSNRYCSVPQCKSRCTKDISLFLFPKDEKTRLEWAKVLEIRKTVSKYMYVCSLHFTKNDFISPDFSRRRLRKAVTPSQNLPQVHLSINKPYIGNTGIHTKSSMLAGSCESEMDGTRHIVENVIEYFYESENDFKKGCYEQIKCRTCMDSVEDGLQLDSECFGHYAIRKAISIIVPNLVPCLGDKDVICQTCFDTLKTTLKFIETSLTVNNLSTIFSGWGSYSSDFSELENESESSPEKLIETLSRKTDLDNYKDQSTLCPYCGKVFSETGLNIHISVAHDLETERQLLCSVCSKTFGSTRALSHHTKFVHDEKKRVSCKLCGKIFKQKYSLQAHLSLKHEKVVKYVCHICGKKFHRTDYYNTHMAEAHSNKVKPKTQKYSKIRNIQYKCKYCSMVYNWHCNLKRHEMLHKENPHYKFRCNVCWKIFTNEDQLNEHRTIHTKNFKCPLCDEHFGRKFLLKIHLSEIHDGARMNELRDMVHKKSSSSVGVKKCTKNMEDLGNICKDSKGKNKVTEKDD